MAHCLPGRKQTLNNWELLDLLAPSSSSLPSGTKYEGGFLCDSQKRYPL